MPEATNTFETIDTKAGHKVYELRNVTINAGASATIAIEEAVDFWAVWLETGINGPLRIYPDSPNASGPFVTIGAAGFAQLPARARYLTIVNSGVSQCVAYVAWGTADFAGRLYVRT